MNEPKLETMKQLYEEIPIPAELEFRVHASIQQAKRERRQNALRTAWKRIGTSAAAIALAAVTLCNISPAFARAAAQVPILGPMVKVVTFRTYEDRQGNYDAHIEIPAVENGPQVLNDDIQTYTEAIIARYQEDMTAAGGEGALSVHLTYRTVTDNDVMFALRFDESTAMGDSSDTVRIYAVEKQTGTMLALKDLFRPDSGWKNILTEEIQSQMRKRMTEDDSQIFWLDSDLPDGNFSELSDSASFYMNADGDLVIVFSEGDVAPMYMGVQEFVIPYTAIREIALPRYWQAS